MIDPNLTQRAFTTILEHFVANGRAPHYAELADALEIDPEEAREVQRAAVEAAPLASCWLARDTDYNESSAPISNVTTHYLIRVGGIQKWYGQ
jgi:DNA-directed RNA polymerase specialized sigma subunit